MLSYKVTLKSDRMIVTRTVKDLMGTRVSESYKVFYLPQVIPKTQTELERWWTETNVREQYYL